MKVKGHLTPEGRDQILELKNSMNTGRHIAEEVDSTGDEPYNTEVFVYNNDRTILYYTVNNVKDLTEELGIKEFLLMAAASQGFAEPPPFK